MGYTTDFEGSLTINPPLNEKQVAYINRLCKTRRMKRDVVKLMEIYNGKYGYPFTKSKDPKVIYGNEGEYFAREDGDSGQSRDKSILDFNTAPGQMEYGNGDFNKVWNENLKRQKAGTCQPGLWCNWEVVAEGEALVWDGGEKFYNYVEWLQYLTKHFFKKWKKKLNGEITWSGEESGDMGKIVVNDNVIKVKKAVVSYRDVD